MSAYTYEITGVTADVFIKDRLVAITGDLSPVRNDNGKLAYAYLLLDWILDDETGSERLGRIKAIEQAFAAHQSDRREQQIRDLTILFPDFLIKVERYHRFMREGA